MQQLNDKWMRIVGVPLLALTGQWIMYGYTNVPYPDDWRVPFFFLLGSVLVWECNRWGIIYSRRRYPELAQTLRRVLYQLIWFITFSSLIRIAQTFIYHQLDLFPTEDYFLFKPYFFNTLVSVVNTVQIAAVFEGIYLYRRWKMSFIETEQLKKVNLQTQLDSLKTQINPHFLFNNLNSLSSLITSDAHQAENFLDELSSVYRYLLQQNNRDLCPLSEEINFINAYFHLLKTRYGDAIFMETDVEPRYLSFLIPPLTLQILFENAIKHNVISVNRPLIIKLYTLNGALHVENNLQKKKSAVASNGIGLQNILMKYKLLDHSTVEVRENSDCFLVTVPLITPVAETVLVSS
ncbi:signal transduction histidine kinase, LytS [Fibrisoma limi BUZ 3]|uniref:Signal transduction histidine kinase, LytS n=1 Tax=Fibrisoma limi BUZ 3 TaxID=1185876 RepID=I2GFN1_9BACT|nr:histidine kinase [Fibrisoma limi]CCH52706.1 signal transduction histidine kinase, LytS [Fibrisoma limi BUZ 3]